MNGQAKSMPLDWKINEAIAVGRGATVQEFFAIVDGSKYVIDVAPWGEGRFTVDGREIANIDGAKDRRQAFKTLSSVAEQFRSGEHIKFEIPKRSPLIPAAKAKLLEGKRGLIVGIANDKSIAWGCARAFRALGTDLAITYLDSNTKKAVDPLAEALDAEILMPLDVTVPGQIESVFESIRKKWGSLDFVVHSIAFSPKEALRSRVADVSREGFLATMDVSCWSFIRMAHLAEPLMTRGGSLFTMTYLGSQRVIPNYNVMGIAKAALESTVRYLAAELGPKGIRVHAISPGPLATNASSGSPELDEVLKKARGKTPARNLVSIDDVGVATAFLAHDAARLITGETLYVDGGYHVVD